MKSITKPAILISAYPLRAVSQSNISNNKPASPYLRALLSGTYSNRNSMGKVRKLSLNRADNNEKRNTESSKHKIIANHELTEKDWFKNYE